MLLCWASLFSAVEGSVSFSRPVIFPAFPFCLNVHLCGFDLLIFRAYEAENTSSVTYLVPIQGLKVFLNGIQRGHEKAEFADYVSIIQ